MIDANSSIAGAKLRVARPTDNPDGLLQFYQTGLGFNLLYRFADHKGFDGIMLGHVGSPYHFEFTHAHEHAAGRASSKDDLLVFYLPHRPAWEAAVARMIAAGFTPQPAFNCYWDERGVTFEDPDGYRVVLENAAWLL